VPVNYATFFFDNECKSMPNPTKSEFTAEFGSSFTMKIMKITKCRENKGKTAFTALLFYPEARTH
jgi:hypothetical protein